MIIKSQEKQKSKIPYKWLTFVVLACAIGYYAYQWISKISHSSASEIFCDAEITQDKTFVSGDYKFINAHTQSADKSFSGKYSSKVEPKSKYGIGHNIKDPKKGFRYIATVRRWTTSPKMSALAIKGTPDKSNYKQTNIAESKDENGWELLKVEMFLSNLTDVDQLSIITYSSSNESVAYFDDLKIEVVPIEIVSSSAKDDLHLYLDDKALNKINEKRLEALEKGILQSSDDDWVKAKLTENGTIPHEVKVRLKGDWTDHLKGNYWSYRIKMPKDKSWKRMQTFSLQDPETRFYLHEWLYHQALEAEDVITPRYGFINFAQNNQSPVLYAYEEHFEKQIAEYKDRREGVIVKFSEDYLWNQRLRNKEIKEKDVFQNVIHNADILPFGESKTFKDPKLTEQFERAQDLMEAYRMRTAPASEVFDMERMAKYYAITDIFNANHGVIWHNLRFYYNPITRKLEPIGFDGFTESGHYRMYVKLFFGEFMSSEDEDEWSAFYKYIFRDPEFISYYVPMMNRFSSTEYMNALFENNADEILNLEQLIRTKIDSKYEFDIASIKSRARTIHKNIQPFNEHSLKAFREDKVGDPTKIIVSNYHCLPLEVIGSSAKVDSKINLLAKSNVVKSNGRKSAPSFTEVTIPASDHIIYFKLLGDDKIYHSNIKDWRRPGELKIQYSTKSKFQIPLPESNFRKDGNKITIRSGHHVLSQPMLIPEGFVLELEPGTTIDMVDKAYIVSYSTVFFRGTKADPIQILSSDKSAQGVTVIQAPQPSILNYTTFQDLNTLEENEWQLTGAVTFYESDVEMTNVTITGNLCEDALNTIRSKFTIKDLNINNTFADGFDGDFCTGKLFDSYFFNTGNDGLDFSGSYVEIDNVKLENLGDKGISAGEQATLVINNTTIKGALIGIASKDLSEVKVTEVHLIDCIEGFVAYRKKPEFGGGTINVKSYTEENVTHLSKKDEESKINFPKK